MKPATLLLLPIVAISLSSCVVEVPDSNQGPGASSYTGAGVSQNGDPSIRTLPNGDIKAVYPGQGRHVLFDRYGNLKAGGPGCDDEDLFCAKQAVRNYLGR